MRMGILPIILTKGERFFWTLVATFGLAFIHMAFIPQLPIELTFLWGAMAGIFIFKAL